MTIGNGLGGFVYFILVRLLVIVYLFRRVGILFVKIVKELVIVISYMLEEIYIRKL